MSILLWIGFGLMGGVIAYILGPSSVQRGFLGSIILGILGAVLGGLLGNTILGINASGISLASLVVSILGAIVLLFIAAISSPKY